MHILSVILLLLAGVPGQIPTPNVNIKLATDVDEVVPGGTVSLSIEVTPDRDKKVYALGASNFTPVTLAITARDDIKVEKPDYPIPERKRTPGTNRRVPLYDDAFKIVQPVTISRKAKPGQVLNIVGWLTYQTCDEEVVYPKKRVPVRWVVTVKQAPPGPQRE